MPCFKAKQSQIDFKIRKFRSPHFVCVAHSVCWRSSFPGDKGDLTRKTSKQESGA